jgi:hypothetical protein
MQKRDLFNLPVDEEFHLTYESRFNERLDKKAYVLKKTTCIDGDFMYNITHIQSNVEFCIGEYYLDEYGFKYTHKEYLKMKDRPLFKNLHVLFYCGDLSIHSYDCSAILASLKIEPRGSFKTYIEKEIK